jgi:predicted DNA-binding transcriptional regulator YafY
MYYPTTRLLATLEMLQSRQQITGTEIAERLEVDIRTARRYIARLGELGIPIESERGRYGAYRLRPGFKLPPLMFTEEEALATALGLLAVRKLNLTSGPGAEGATAKLERVLPVPLRDRVRALEETLILDLPANGAPIDKTILTLCEAASRRQRVALRYRSWEGVDTERQFDPFSLVFHGAQWYVAGYCRLRNDLRLFRLDRMEWVKTLDEFFVRPAQFDGLDFTLRSLGGVPRSWRVDVLLQTTLEQACRWITPDVAVLETEDSGVRLHCYTHDLKWLARLLARLECRLIVQQPPELVEMLRQHALSILASIQGQ